jgi:M-phase inducer tyrosine phosphatase
MDTSPLPAKTPLCTAIEITSPTPAQTPEINEDDDDDEMMMLDSPAPISRQSSFEATKPTGFE